MLQNICIFFYLLLLFSHHHVQLFATSCQASLSFPISQTLLKLMSIESVILYNYLILCHSLLLLPSIFLNFRICPNESPLASDDKSIGASAPVLPMNIWGWFPLGLTGLISLQGLSRVFSSTTIQSINSVALSFLYSPTLTSIHDYWKNHRFDYTDLCQQSGISAF